MFLKLSLVLMILLFVTSCYVIWNLSIKLESLEDWVENFSAQIILTQRTLEELDSEGKFKSDDEIGTVFTAIKDTINDLNKITEEDI